MQGPHHHASCHNYHCHSAFFNFVISNLSYPRSALRMQRSGDFASHALYHRQTLTVLPFRLIRLLCSVSRIRPQFIFLEQMHGVLWGLDLGGLFFLCA